MTAARSCSSMPGARPWAPSLLALTDSPRTLSPVPHRVLPAAPCVAGLCDAVRCIGHRSALHRLSQRAAMASAACCVFASTVVLGILPCLPPVSLQPYLPASGAAGGLLLCPFARSEHLSLSQGSLFPKKVRPPLAVSAESCNFVATNILFVRENFMRL